MLLGAGFDKENIWIGDKTRVILRKLDETGSERSIARPRFDTAIRMDERRQRRAAMKPKS